MLDASDRAGGLMSHYQINANTDATDVENMGSGLQYTFDPYWPTQTEVGAIFGVSYATVSRAVKLHEAVDCLQFQWCSAANYSMYKYSTKSRQINIAIADQHNAQLHMILRLWPTIMPMTFENL